MLPQHPFYAFKGPLCSHLPSLLQAQRVFPVSSQGSPLSFRTSWLSQTQAPPPTSYPFYLSHSDSLTSPSVSNQKDPQVSSSPKQNLKKKKKYFFSCLLFTSNFIEWHLYKFCFSSSSQPLSHALSAVKVFLLKQVGHPPGQVFLPISYN